MKTELNLEIKGMHCKSCAELIKSHLSGLDGIESADASYAEERAKIRFDSDKISQEKIEEEINGLGYSVKKNSPDKNKAKRTLRQGIIYGLVPHIGCIGFIIASVLGVTVAIEFFRPLLMNPWFFHILVLISLVFATISSAFYLKKNGILSWKGIKRKKKYLSTMYGSTVGINLVLFLVIFPLTANLDTGSFANNPTGAVSLAGADTESLGNSLLKLQVNIPCPGHAPLISGELKGIEGVTGVKFDFPNYFNVAFDSRKTSKEEIISLEVFDTYNATVISEAIEESISLAEVKEVEEVSSKAPTTTSSCGGSCGSCGTSSCGCSGR